MDGWLSAQAQVVHSMANSLVYMNTTDKDEIEGYLEASLKENDNALMYYVCFEYNKSVFPADHSEVDLDPTSREWWKAAMEKQGLIYTAPYKDFTSGKMIVSIAEPAVIGGQQAVVLADITIDTLVKLTSALSKDKDMSAFLVTGDGSVVAHDNEKISSQGRGKHYYYRDVARY